MGLWVSFGVWALVVAISLWAPVRRGWVGFAVFLLSMTVNEIPLVLLAVFAVVVGAAVVDPPGEEALGVPTVVLASAVGIGLVWIQVRARSAAPALQRALHELGADALGRPRRAVRQTTRVWLAGMLLPFQRRMRGVRRLRNIAYGPDPRFHRLDAYVGPGGIGLRPILIHFHGGGFAQGGKSRESVVLLNQLAAHGWLCLSANYRLRSAGAHPRPLEDAKRVIAWARREAARYEADAGHVFLVGSSAGGHLALSAALTPNRADLQPGFESEDTSVAGAVVCYAYFGRRTADPASSPIALARADAPPILVIHGAHDTLVPPTEARRAAEELRATSANPVVYAELPAAQHDFDFFGSVRARVTADAVESFLNWATLREVHRPTHECRPQPPT